MRSLVGSDMTDLHPVIFTALKVSRMAFFQGKLKVVPTITTKVCKSSSRTAPPSSFPTIKRDVAAKPIKNAYINVPEKSMWLTLVILKTVRIPKTLHFKYFAMARNRWFGWIRKFSRYGRLFSNLAISALVFFLFTGVLPACGCNDTQSHRLNELAAPSSRPVGHSAGDIPACGDSQVGQGDLSVLEGDLQMKMQFASKLGVSFSFQSSMFLLKFLGYWVLISFPMIFSMFKFHVPILRVSLGGNVPMGVPYRKWRLADTVILAPTWVTTGPSCAAHSLKPLQTPIPPPCIPRIHQEVGDRLFDDAPLQKSFWEETSSPWAVTTFGRPERDSMTPYKTHTWETKRSYYCLLEKARWWFQPLLVFDNLWEDISTWPILMEFTDKIVHTI